MYEDAAKAGVTVIGLRNVLSDAEMEEKLKLLRVGLKVWSKAALVTNTGV